MNDVKIKIQKCLGGRGHMVSGSRGGKWSRGKVNDKWKLGEANGKWE